MPGTKEGAAKARAAIIAKYGKDFYKTVGALGGAASNTGGFYKRPDLARAAGLIGGYKSKRPAGPPRFCELEGCERRYKARGMCELHYKRNRQALKRKAKEAAASKHE